MKASDFTLLVIRLFLGFVFFSSGLCKLTDGNFGQLIGPPHLIADLAKYGLAGFGNLVAVSQVLIGALILTQRFSLIGLIALVPMNVSILGVTISQQWQGTPFVNAFLLLLNLICILYELQTIKILFLQHSTSITTARSIRLFPSLKLPVLILGFTILLLLFSGRSGFQLDLLASITLFLVIINLFQFRKFILLEKIVLIFYSLTILQVVNFRFLKNVENKEFVFVGVIALGFICFLLSVFKRIRLNKTSV